MRSWSAAVGFAAVGTAIAASLSCRQIVGITDSPPMGPPATTACGLPWKTGTCASCVETHCCSEASACATTDARCAAYFQCLGACAIGDWQCRAQCQVDFPIGGASQFAPLTMCTAGQCANDCGLACGVILNALPDAAVACHDCFAASTSTCDNALKCYSSADCLGWVACTGACSTPDCQTACADRYGFADAGVAGAATSGVPPELAPLLSTSGLGPCGEPCGFGRSWACVDQPVWPNPTLDGTTLETDVVDTTSGKTVAGVAVSICRFADPTCASPLNPVAGETDANGHVAVVVPPSPNGLDYVLADTFAQFTSPAIVPALYFLGYPVSEPRAPIAAPEVVVLSASNPPAGWDQTLGLVSASAIDCSGIPAPGVKFAIDVTDAGVVPYYADGSGNPDLTLTATTTQGAAYGGGFVNVPPGTVTITATPIALGKPSAHAHVLVRAGTFTYVFLRPGTGPTQ